MNDGGAPPADDQPFAPFEAVRLAAPNCIGLVVLQGGPQSSLLGVALLSEEQLSCVWRHGASGVAVTLGPGHSCSHSCLCAGGVSFSVERLRAASIKQRAINGLMLQQLGVVVQVVLQLVTLGILARTLSPQDFGVFSVATVFSNFAGLISQMGVGPALVQREELQDAHVATGFTLSVVLGLVFAVLIYLSSPLVAEYYREPMLHAILKFVALTFVISSAATVPISLMQRRLEFGRFVTVNLASYVVGYCLVSVAMALLGYGIWALVGGTLAQATLKLALGFALGPNKPKLGFSLLVARDLLSFGGGFTLSRIFNYFATQGDYLVLGRIAGANVLGIYSRAYQLMSVPSSHLGSVLERVMFPVLARTQRDKLSLARYFLVASRGLALVTMTASALLLVTAPEVVTVVLGAQWDEVVGPFRVMAFALFARTGYKLSDSLAKATGKVYSRAVRELVYALMVMVGTWVGYSGGIVGASVAVSLAIVFNWLIGLALSRRILELSWRDLVRAHAKPAFFGLLTALVAWIIRRVALGAFSFGPVAILAVTVSATGILLVVTSLAFPSVLGSEIFTFLFVLLGGKGQQKWRIWIRNRVEGAIKKTEKSREGASV